MILKVSLFALGSYTKKSRICCVIRNIAPTKTEITAKHRSIFICLVGHKMSVNQTAEMSVARYFELVFEYAISKKIMSMAFCFLILIMFFFYC